MGYIASIFMETFARTWTQGGTAGYYMMSSANNSTGYVYFIGATTTGGPLGKTLYVSHSFTSIEVVANRNDLVSLYKASTKTTSDITTPGTRYVDWLYNSKYTAYTYKSGTTNTSSPWVLPGSAMPLVDIAVIAGGGGAWHHGGGGGGGGVVYLTYFPVSSGSLSWSVGAGGPQGSNGGNTVLNGTITAIGGGSSGNNRGNGAAGGSGGGGSSHGSTGGTQYGGSATQTQPSVVSPTVGVGYGNRGGNIAQSSQHVGGGGGGAGAQAADGGSNSQTSGGAGHLCAIDFMYYGAGGGGSNHDTKVDGISGSGAGNWGQGANSLWNSNNTGTQGGIVLRYYT